MEESPSSRKQLLERFRHVVSSILNVDEAEIKEGSSIIDDLHATSLNVIELLLALEKEFEIDIEDQDAQKLLIVKNAIDYIENSLKLKES